MEKTTLAQESINVLLDSLGENSKEILLKTLINEKSHNERVLLFESMAFDLYGGVKMRETYHFTVFSLCSGGDQFCEEKELLLKFYQFIKIHSGNELEWDGQIMFASKGHYHSSDPEEEDLVALEGEVNFECARKVVGKGNYDRPIYGNELFEHPDARSVHSALMALKPDMFLWPLIVIRHCIDDNLETLNKDGQRRASTSDEINMISKCLKLTGYCTDLDGTSEKEFSFPLNDFRWYVFWRHLHCDGGGL